MENRVLITVVICVAIFIGWMFLFPIGQPPQRAKPPAPAAPVAGSVPSTPPPGNPSAAPAAPTITPGGPLAAGTVVGPAPSPSPAGSLPDLAHRPPEEEAVFVMEGLQRVVISSWGARVKSFQLLNPQYRVGDEQRTLVDLVKGWFGWGPARPTSPPEVRPVDLVTATDELFWPLGLSLLPRSGIDLTGREAYQRIPTPDDPLRALFSWHDPQGRVTIEKDYRFRKDSHLFELEIRVRNTGAYNLPVSLTLNTSGRQQPGAEGGLFTGPGNIRQGICYVRDDVVRKTLTELQEGTHAEAGNVRWSGTTDQYFLQAIVTEPLKPDATEPANCAFYSTADLLNSVLSNPARDLAPGAILTSKFPVYFGPKNFYELRQLGYELQQAVYFDSPMIPGNWLRFICEPMLWLMRTFHSWTGNWGLAIILLTFFIKIITFYLNHKSFKSMAEMQKLKPELDELRKKFENDKNRMNQEIWALHRRHKVNPLGGCLPMLVQMPIWIALYQTIYSSAELYKAGFIWYIKDLTAPDPYFVLPLLFGGLTYLQQKLTPQTMDNAQQRMMLTMMPIMFTALMLFLPSGLVLYIVANSLLSLAQQKMFFRTKTPPPARANSVA